LHYQKLLKKNINEKILETDEDLEDIL